MSDNLATDRMTAFNSMVPGLGLSEIEDILGPKKKLSRRQSLMLPPEEPSTANGHQFDYGPEAE